MGVAARPPCDAGVIQGGRPGHQCDRKLERWILAATILGSGMAFVDGTVVNVALPAIQSGLGASAFELQWIVEAYALLLASLLLAGGAMGDRFGRRRVFGIGTLVFTAASAWCGLAPDTRQLIAARAVQGVGAALLVPGSLALISASFEGERRGRAIGTWSGFTAITAALGPVLGGWLVDNFSWRWAFAINIPVGAVVMLLLWLRVPESRDEDATKLDVAGSVLVTLGLGGVVFALIEAGPAGWSPVHVAAALAGLAALAAFVLWEQRTATPMLPPGLFKSRTFAGANLLTLLLYAALSGALFFVPLALVQVHGYGATEAGAAFLPFIALMFTLSRWSGGLVDRLGGRTPLVIGPLIAALGFALLAIPGTDLGGEGWMQGYATSFLPGMTVLGLGMAVTVAPLTTVVMGAVSATRSGLASGVNNAVSRAAGLVAIAVFGLLMTNLFQSRLSAGLAEAGVPQPIVAEVMSRSGDWAAAKEVSAPSEVEAAIHDAVDAAFVAGFRRLMLLAALLAAVSSASALLLIGEQAGRNGSR